MKPAKGLFRTLLLYGLIVLFVFVALLFLLRRPEAEPRQAVYEAAGLFLPENTGVLFCENTFGWFGDGEGLTVFSLTEQDINALLNAYSFQAWRPLPLSRAMRGHLQSGDFGGQWEKQSGFLSSSGYYLYLETGAPAAPRRAFDPEQGYPNDYLLALVDLKGGRVYFYEFHS